MEPLFIKPTIETPEVNFDKASNKLEIKGKSLPEEAKKFYQPVYEWIENYIKNPNEETHFYVKLDYFNSSTSTILLEILHLLDSIHKKGKPVTIHWHYLEVDDDMRDAGEEFEELLSMPFIYEEMEEI